MRSHFKTRLARATILAALLFTAACSTDSVTGAVAPSQANLSASPVTGGQTTAAAHSVNVGGHHTPLTRAVKVKATIGAKGGRISIPELGFELVVPRGAVSKPTRFQVRAMAGNALSYEFEPHGTTFNVPLIFRQDGRYTSIGLGTAISGGYFADPLKVDTRGKKAEVAEQLPARWSGPWIEFEIKHFSGYLVSCA